MIIVIIVKTVFESIRESIILKKIYIFSGKHAHFTFIVDALNLHLIPKCSYNYKVS